MLIANDAIHGWSPSGDDDAEVNVSQDMCFMTISPITPSSSILSPICPPLSIPLPITRSPQPQPIPLTPLTGVTRPTMAPSSDRRAQRNRNRDPSWIPRPRNAFIIFRCEYSREHAQGAQESQNDDTNSTATAKTLSKRAAETWKRLPATERERYKVLADQEREEHARLYPHYRFRPMKRQMSGTGKSSRERSESPKESSVNSRLAPSLPSVLAGAPKKAHLNPSIEQGEAPGFKLMPQVATAPALLPESPSYTFDRAGSDPEVSLGLDYGDPILFYPSPEATLLSELSPPSAHAELYSPLCTSAASIPPDTFRCNDSTSGLDLTHGDLERAQALEAYAIGLYHHDLFSPFSFPEYY